ncbi:uncharacterized protein LOC120388467 [Mauremys reevesii]|uniref:uncharacterized protein LOC120388467 n=1 Tax=Mauremys reevesii TaxID=260615 RepID=UPI00193F85CE|nr:uncharacterized protein LOC120388467 [Mauremys reevesii]
MQSWFCACFDSSWVLYTCVLLVLVIWVAMVTQHSFSWRSRMALLVSRLRQRGMEDEGEGAKKQRVKQPRDRLCQDHPHRARQAARRSSIRQLLCDNSDCALCNEAARQAERLVYADRASVWVPARPGSPPTPASCSKGRNLLGRSMWRGLDVLQVLPPAQGPFQPSKTRSPPERQAGSRKTARRLLREDEEELSHPQQAKDSSTEQDECLFCSSLWDETLLRGQKQAQSSSSLQHEPPLFAWELRTGSSQHEPFLPRREEYPGPAPVQHKPFPPSQAEHGWVGSFLRRVRAKSPQAAPQRQAHRPDWVPFLAKSPGGTRMSGREAKRQRDRESTAPRATGEAPMSLAGRPLARVSAGALRVPGRLEFAEVETPFLQRDVRASLERHVQVKRLQHTLGLSCTLQSALKIFMPPAPKPIARKPSGAGRVVMMPQALPFLSVGSRTELERHLQRMVHLKRWGLPRRIQESLRLLMPATPPHPRLGPLPSGRWAPRGPGPVTRAAQTPDLRARAPAQASQGPARASKSAPSSHCCRDTRELQGHIARKGLEIRLGALPAVLRSSQKMAALGSRDLLLPKLIPPGCKAPLARHRLCPLLSCKAGSVELNVRHKHIQYLWALPTLYAESLAKMVPCPPMPPTPLLPLGVAIEFCPLETPFVAPEGRELLERHVLRKRLQHEWGLPGLVWRSLRCLMPPPPTRPGPKGSDRQAAMELHVSSGAPPIPLATKRELEAHIRWRVAERRWGLPRRVQESLRGFMPPTTAALGTHPDTQGRRASRPLRGLSARRASRESPSRAAPVGPTAVAVSLAGLLGTAWRQQLRRDTCHQLLERHVTRKNIEIRLGLIPRRAQHSQEAARRVGKLPLPRLIRPGQRSLELRPRELLFLEQAASDHLELNLLHKHLSFRWGLPTLYQQSLAKLFHAGPSPAPPPSSSRTAGTEFTEQELPFLPPGAQEELELHVRKKRLQHEWGLPLIVQKSMRGLMAAAPCPGQPKAPPPADGDVAVLQPELSFLSEGSRRELELSLRKRLMHRRWGLPRRIQESVRLLQPAAAPAEFRPRSHTEKDAEGPFLLPWHKSTVHLEQGVGKARRVVTAPHPRLSLGRDAQERLQIHVAKKCVETRLGAVPAAVRCSWQRLHLVSRLPLPKLIPAGDRTPKARSPQLPFVHPEDVCHLELNVQHKHLTALWGLGTLYTQSLSRMVPRAPPGPVPPRETEVEFWAQEALFLGPEAREALELHVRKKRLQHEWGFPALIERSLRAFVPEPTAARQRAELHILVLGQEPSLMDGDTRGRLERHLRKMMLQRRWSLPRRIQESLRLFAAFAPPAVPQLPGAGGERGVGQSRLGPSQPDIPAGSCLAGDSRSHGLAAERRDELQRHLARKCLEIRLGVRPALVKRSQRAAREGERIRLPRLICAGQKPPKPRAGSLLCLPPTAVNTLDMNVRHKQLVHFWGLPTLQAASLRRMMPKAPAVPLGSAAGRAWTQMGLAGRVGAEELERNGYKEPPLVMGPPLITAKVRDRLESHILRKKLQHEWDLPRVVLRSLGAFTPPPPGRGLPRRVQAPASESVTTGSLLFLHMETREHLESHVRKLALERRWGLPKRILESLRMFLPPAPPGAEPRGQTQPRLHVFPTLPQGPTALSTGQSEELQPGPGEPLTHRSQHWLEMGVKEGKASCPEAVSQHTLGSSSRRSQETSQTSNGEGPPSSPRHFPEDKAELKSTLDFPRKKVLGISHRAQESQRQALRPAAHDPHPQQREQSSEESPGQWRTHDGEGAPRMAGTSRRSRSSSVETAIWNEKRILRELESSFRRIAQSRGRHGPGGKQSLSLEIVGHLEMDQCTCLDCPCCKLEVWDGARSPGASSPGWQTHRIHARGSATLLGDAAAPSPLHAEPGWQGQGTPSVAKYEPPASSLSSLEGSESRASDWSVGESSRAASRPAPEGPMLARVHLASLRAAAHQLDIHLAQKALGSFILPPCVIRSQAIYADMAAERLRAAAQEHRREMNIRLQRRRGRKSQMGGPHQEALGERARPAGTGEPGFPTAGSLGQRLIRESQSQANQYLCETCHGLFTAGEEGLSPQPWPAEGAGKSDVARTQLETHVHSRGRKTSDDACRGEQGASYQRSRDLSRAAGAPPYEGPAGAEDGEEAGGQMWAPPAHHPRLVTRDNVGDKGSSAASNELVGSLSSSRWPASPSEQRPRSAEGLSQFSTEGEWEMVGDWDSEAVAAWDAEGEGSLGWKERRDTEGRRGMREMLAEGTGPRAGTNMRQTEALVLTEAPPGAEQPPRAPPGRGAESPSVPCKGKGSTFRGIMLGFLKRVTSRASVEKRGQVDRSVAAPHGAPPPPQKLAPSPKSVTFNANVHVRAEVRRCQLCSSAEEMDGAGRKEPAAAARTRGLPGNGAPQGSGAAFPDARRGDSVTRGEPPSPEETGLSAEYGGYQEQVTLKVTECREGKVHDPSGTPAASAGPSAPWPPPPVCPAARDARTTGSHKGEGGKGVSQSGSAALGSNQPSPRESSRTKLREQRGRALSPSRPRGRSRSRVEGPWCSGRARRPDSEGIQVRSREWRSSSRGRPTSRRTRSRSREEESLVGEGVQDWQGTHRRPGKARSHGVATAANGVGGNATEDTSGTVGASNLEHRGHRARLETELPQPGSHPGKSTGHVCWFHQHRAHAHLRHVHDRTPALREENLCSAEEAVPVTQQRHL